MYRARRVQGDFSPASGIEPRDLSYPPAQLCKAGRLNRAGAPLFYASTSKSPLLFELEAGQGEQFILSIWRMDESPILSSLGYVHSVFSALGAQRGAPSWLSTRAVEPQDAQSNFHKVDLLGELFAQRVQPFELEKYKLTAAIAELHYGLLEGGARQFAGAMYPSVAMWANGDNIALRPWFVDAHMHLTKAIHIRVDSTEDKTFSITELDKAFDVDSQGKLRWVGHTGVRFQTSVSVRCTFTEGRDELGDYIIGKDNVFGHWACVDEMSGRKFTV